MNKEILTQIIQKSLNVVMQFSSEVSQMIVYKCINQR